MVKQDDLKIIKIHQRVHLPEEIQQFHELPKISKVIRIAGLLQQVYCHVRNQDDSPDQDVLAKSYLLKEYCEFFLARYTQEDIVDTLFINFVLGARSLEKCVEPSDWPTICRQETPKQVLLMFLFLSMQNEYLEEIKG